MISARQEMGVEPIVEGRLDRDVPLSAERYLFNGHDLKISANYGTVMIVHFGGARVEAADPSSGSRIVSVPSKVLLLAPRNATRWHYSGVAEFGIFYFPDDAIGLVEKIKELVPPSCAPVTFTDTLVSAAAMEMLREFEKGSCGNEEFATRLAHVMLEQTLRVVTNPQIRVPPTRHVHLARLEATIKYIRQNIGSDLSVEILAARAGVSVTHFRRLFRESTATSPHHYVLAMRLARALEMLKTTSVPIARIALECGFSDQSHFTKAFRETHRTTPAEFRNAVQKRN